MKEESESLIHGRLPMKIIWNLFLVLSYCVVILRTTLHWSFRMTSFNFKLLTWKQQIRITFAGWVWTNNKFQTIIMGTGIYSLSSSSLVSSWYVKKIILSPQTFLNCSGLYPLAGIIGVVIWAKNMPLLWHPIS